MTRLLVVGDVHGQFRQLAAIAAGAAMAHGVEAVLQVGDFGFGSWGMRRLNAPFGVPVHAICGNHERHRWLRRQVRNGRHLSWAERICLFYQSRGSIHRFSDVSVGFLGGALNIDRPQSGNRRRGNTNYILPDQTDRACADFNYHRPDVLVTHSCPSRIGIGMRANPVFTLETLHHVICRGYDPGPKDDCGEAELTRLWSGLAYRPRCWFYGHFHTYRERCVDGTRFVCLPPMGTEVVLWDSAVDGVRVLPTADCIAAGQS